MGWLEDSRSNRNKVFSLRPFLTFPVLAYRSALLCFDIYIYISPFSRAHLNSTQFNSTTALTHQTQPFIHLFNPRSQKYTYPFIPPYPLSPRPYLYSYPQSSYTLSAFPSTSLNPLSLPFPLYRTINQSYPISSSLRTHVRPSIS